MFETVIVPLDGSPHAELAIPYAVDEARRHQAKLVLIHVIPRPEPCMSPVRRSGPVPWQGEWPFEDLDSAKRNAEAYLRDVVNHFGLDPGTTLSVAVGDPGVRVAAEAMRHERPLVVMLTGDRTRDASPPLSLVTRYLLIAGAVPVLGLRQPPTDRLRTPPGSGSDDVQPRMTRPGPVIVPSVLPADSPVPG
ncbi:MAG: usp21 [Thermomicrobiales bacterium]|jgi:nucleotide-binding universal stress UspA family protein|nr:usp21 [Thermomicrobiales bacterium]